MAMGATYDLSVRWAPSSADHSRSRGARRGRARARCRPGRRRHGRAELGPSLPRADDPDRRRAHDDGVRRGDLRPGGLGLSGYRRRRGRRAGQRLRLRLVGQCLVRRPRHRPADRRADPRRRGQHQRRLPLSHRIGGRPDGRHEDQRGRPPPRCRRHPPLHREPDRVRPEAPPALPREARRVPRGRCRRPSGPRSQSPASATAGASGPEGAPRHGSTGDQARRTGGRRHRWRPRHRQRHRAGPGRRRRAGRDRRPRPRPGQAVSRGLRRTGAARSTSPTGRRSRRSSTGWSASTAGSTRWSTTPASWCSAGCRRCRWSDSCRRSTSTSRASSTAPTKRPLACAAVG